MKSKQGRHFLVEKCQLLKGVDPLFPRDKWTESAQGLHRFLPWDEVKEFVIAPLDWTTPKTFLVPFHSRVLPVCILKTRPICVVDKRKVVAFDLVDVPYILVCLGIRLIFFHWVLPGHCCCDFSADSETLHSHSSRGRESSCSGQT